MRNFTLSWTFLLLALVSITVVSISNRGLAAEEKREYQVGSVWGKYPLTLGLLNSRPDVLPIAKATAHLTYSFTRNDGSRGTKWGSIFYLGKFNGHHIAATNSHLISPGVMAGRESCGNFELTFHHLTGEPKILCQELIGAWPELDFALLILQPTAGQEKLLQNVGLNFDFNADIEPGAMLFSVGYSPLGKIPFLVEDQDCRVFSGKNLFKLLPNPDDHSISFKPKEAWSFANGCDSSLFGDCGAVYVDKRTQKIIGMYWTGTYSKKVEFKQSEYLKTLTPESDEIWQGLTYGVPTKLIKQEILKTMSSFPKFKQEILHSLLNK